jgi:uncharacterized membrane protein
VLDASRVARGVAIAAGAVAYAVLAHLSNARPGHEILGVLLSMGPLWIAALILAWRSPHRLVALAAVAIGTGLVILRWSDLEAHFAWVYLAQQAGTYLILAAAFGRTLGAGRKPLCARFAEAVHGPLAPDVARYTRAVTLAWTILFCMLAALLVVLYAFAPLAVWSAFGNFGCAILIGLMFAIEYLVRRRTLPDLEHHGFLATFRAIALTPRDSVASPPG